LVYFLLFKNKPKTFFYFFLFYQKTFFIFFLFIKKHFFFYLPLYQVLELFLDLAHRFLQFKTKQNKNVPGSVLRFLLFGRLVLSAFHCQEGDRSVDGCPVEHLSYLSGQVLEYGQLFPWLPCGSAQHWYGVPHTS
jgi:hypothetical protein